MNTQFLTLTPASHSSPRWTDSLADAVRKAGRRIAPLWPLKDFVAVNPFVGLSDIHFLDAAALMRANAHGDILPEAADGEVEPRNTEKTLPTVADAIDQMWRTNWAGFVTEEISKWCSVYFDEGQSSWRMPWRELGFYVAWRKAAQWDANPRLSGLESFDQTIRSLPEEPQEVVAHVLSQLGVDERLWVDFLHRQLLSIFGWSSHVQYLAHQKSLQGRIDNPWPEFLAVRLAYDLALWNQSRDINSGFTDSWRQRLATSGDPIPDAGLLRRYRELERSEESYQNGLIKKITSNPGPLRTNPRPYLQAVFCIDVRSEVYRRHLEAQDAGIATLGFAGFFAMPIEHVPYGHRHGTSQCPVLFAPKYKVREERPQTSTEMEMKSWRRHMLEKRVHHAWNAFKTSAISCFSYVETTGLGFGVKLGAESLGWTGQKRGNQDAKMQIQWLSAGLQESGLGTGIPAADQVNLAESALRNMGLVGELGRLVLFCAHGSQSANNPYAAGLDCGACGGHAGGPNAQVAAGILNQPEVREALRHRRIFIPEDTYFLASQHNTTTDEMTLYHPELVPSSHAEDLQRLRRWLLDATRLTRIERAERLGLLAEKDNLAAAVNLRSRDWSQVRPEWGLANNAALIAAPRRRTRGLNLEGRTFLHDYDSAFDPEGKVLELILTAPVVVASWINLQYYASRVNNRLFGSGNKTIHNVVGTLGIWQGNGGDLQVGLPMQSLHDGKKWMHEPLRLSVFIESPHSAIDQVLRNHPSVAKLVRHEWLHLFAIEPGGSNVAKSKGDGEWV